MYVVIALVNGPLTRITTRYSDRVVRSPPPSDSLRRGSGHPYGSPFGFWGIESSGLRPELEGSGGDELWFG